jgi:hypothetical protein
MDVEMDEGLVFFRYGWICCSPQHGREYNTPVR